MNSEFDEVVRKRIASLPDGSLEVNAFFEPYDCGDETYSCKPITHQAHDVLCSDVHDAHYCYTCDHWVEDVCADKKCKLCKGRPEKMVKDVTD